MTGRREPPTAESITAARLGYGRRLDALRSSMPDTDWARAMLALAEDAISSALAAENERLLDRDEAVAARRALDGLIGDPATPSAVRDRAVATLRAR